MLLVLFVVLGFSQALTPEEIAMFKPRQPDHIERNTGLKAHYKIVDNADGSHTFMGNDIPPHDTWKYPRGEGNPFTLKAQNLTVTFNKDPIFRYHQLHIKLKIQINAKLSNFSIQKIMIDNIHLPVDRLHI